MTDEAALPAGFDLLFDINTMAQLAEEHRNAERVMTTLNEMIADHDLTERFDREVLRQEKDNENI